MKRSKVRVIKPATSLSSEINVTPLVDVVLVLVWAPSVTLTVMVREVVDGVSLPLANVIARSAVW